METTIGAQGSNCAFFALRRCVGAVRSTWRRERQHKAAVMNIMRILVSLSRIPVRNAILAGMPSSRLCVECPKAPAIASICCCLPCSVQFRCLASCLTELLLRSPRRVGRGWNPSLQEERRPTEVAASSQRCQSQCVAVCCSSRYEHLSDSMATGPSCSNSSTDSNVTSGT